ncbi:MAG: D-alanyl-D-alanine carboxypeptidase/D-alanyl-D-alanine-endopeptidase [Candidatus Kapabacteria bacterium]|nr:D-alanyl-D-alanine carboxypeptidase/D-alanyl-D-alanine-endopeptidase [Candidatus Kapabacteria bacterium]MDW8012852.1 D-alanyl-D-alanine carboxypeptidase/D-alanyl-D-alanine-endopeptidase [Bacteroidota bacterium]
MLLLVHGAILLAVAGVPTWARCSALDSAAAVESLRNRLKALLQPLERRAQVGVVVADRTGRPLFEQNARLPLTPASTTKLFWTVAALATFGDSAAVVTRVVASAAVDAQGTIHGDLYVVGGGDALLTVRELEEIAAQLARQGVRRVTGSVLADGSLFDEERYRLQYSGDTDVVQPLPPITALGFNRNEVRVVVSAVRGRLTAQTVPLSPAFIVDVSRLRCIPVRRKGRRAVRAVIHVRSFLKGSVQRIVLSGRVPAEGTWSVSVPMEAPEIATAATFLQRLRAAGIRVEGGFGVGICPRSGIVLAEYRRSLAEVVAVVNKKSDNFVAEHLFKLVGAAAHGEGSHAQQARMVLQRLLEQWGIPCTECRLRDGSGLSRRNRVTAADLVMLLARALQAPFAGAFLRSLAVSGMDGTLKHRLGWEESRGRCWAKTGTLRNVSALAGYAATADQDSLLFAILSFGRTAGAKAVEDSLVATLNRFSFCRPLSQGQ